MGFLGVVFLFGGVGWHARVQTVAGKEQEAENNSSFPSLPQQG